MKTEGNRYPATYHLSPRHLFSVLAGVVPFVVYLLSAARSVYSFDSAEFATAAYVLGIVHAPGYPLYLLFAKLFTLLPVGEVAFRVNLLSGVLGAATTFLLFRISLRLGVDTVVSFVLTLVFAFTRVFWSQCVVAEVYTLHLFFLALLISLLLEWDATNDNRLAGWVALTYALSLTNHTSGLLFLPALLAFALPIIIRRRWTFGTVAGVLLGWVGGFLPYLYLPLRASAQPVLDYPRTYFGQDLTTLDGMWWMVTARMFHPAVLANSLTDISSEALSFVGWIWVEYLGIGLLVGVVGVWRCMQFHKRFLLMLGLMMAANVAFFSAYGTIDKEGMYLPSFFVWELFILVALRSLDGDTGGERETENNRLAIGTMLTGRTATVIGSVVVFSLLIVNWPVVDQSQNSAVTQFSSQVLDVVAEDALVLAQWTTATPLEYYQVVEGRRPDVWILDTGLFRLAAHDRLRERQTLRHTHLQVQAALEDLVAQEILIRPVYLTYEEPFLLEEYSYDVVADGVFLLRPLP